MKTKTQLLALLVVLTTAAVPAATLPPGFSESVVASGLSNPTAMDFAPDGRLFVCQQAGQLRVIKNDVLLAAPFLTVTPDSTGERGLLGVTFDPDFVNNQWVYIYYTGASGSCTRFSVPQERCVPIFDQDGQTQEVGESVAAPKLATPAVSPLELFA